MMFPSYISKAKVGLLVLSIFLLNQFLVIARSIQQKANLVEESAEFMNPQDAINPSIAQKRQINCNAKQGLFKCGFDGKPQSFPTKIGNRLITLGVQQSCCKIGVDSCCDSSGLCAPPGTECCGKTICQPNNFCCSALKSQCCNVHDAFKCSCDG